MAAQTGQVQYPKLGKDLSPAWHQNCARQIPLHACAWQCAIMATGSLPSEELLDDLCTRFILNVPAEDLQCAPMAAFLFVPRPRLSFA